MDDKGDRDIHAVFRLGALRPRCQHCMCSSVWRLILYRLSVEEGRLGLAALVEEQGRRLQVHDTILLRLRDLLTSRHPSRTLETAELDDLIRQHLNGLAMHACGVWVYYAWSGRLVHLLDEGESVEPRTNRNRYKITTAEQAELSRKRIGVVGLSVGQAAAAVLALERSFGELRLADFDTIDLSNLNRIRAGAHSLGVPKVYVAAREILEIDPYLKLTVFPQGVSAENAGAFLVEGGKLDVVIEECDSLDIKVLIRHHAPRHRIPVVMDASDRGMLDIERFDIEPDRPLFHGVAGDLQVETLRGCTTEEKIPYALRIVGADTMSSRGRSSMLEIGSTLLTWPQLGPAVSLGGAAAADAARRILLGQERRSGRFFFDLEGKPRLQQRRKRMGSERPLAGVLVVDALVRELVSAAILAPSGGNGHHWRWLAKGNEIRLFPGPSRTSGLIDFENCGSYVALGCAAENVVNAEQFNQNINSMGFGAANLARQSIEAFQQYMAIALMFAVHAVDLRTYALSGRNDAQAWLSPATAELYRAVRAVVERPPSPERPCVWNDNEQPLDAHIARLAADIASSGRLPGAMEWMLPGLAEFAT